jgi:hypothetical protein
MTRVTTRMTMYWLSKNTSPMLKPGTAKMLSRLCGRGPYVASTPFSNRIDAPIVLMITGRKPRWRSG